MTTQIEALAQPAQQEPVAWMSPSWVDPDTRGWQSDSFESIPIEGWLPIYTTPPQRPWVELAPEDRLCAKDMLDAPEGIEAVIDYITAKLKEKNNG